jgi:hypothetical protein
VGCMWLNKHYLGVISISQIIKSRCYAVQRHVSLVGMKEHCFFFNNGKWSKRRKGGWKIACHVVI